MMVSNASHTVSNKEGFSLSRVMAFASMHRHATRPLIYWFAAVSAIFAVLTLLPVSADAQIGIITLVWGILPFMVYLSPLVFARGGDARIVLHLVPATVPEKFTYYMFFLIIEIPVVVYAMPLLAAWIYTMLPSIQHPKVLFIQSFHVALANVVNIGNVLQMFAITVCCFYFVMRCRTNRMLKGILSVFATQFVFGFIGAVYGFTQAMMSGVSNSGVGISQVDAVQFAESLIKEMVFNPITFVIYSLFAAYLIFISYKTYRLLVNNQL